MASIINYEHDWSFHVKTGKKHERQRDKYSISTITPTNFSGNWLVAKEKNLALLHFREYRNWVQWTRQVKNMQLMASPREKNWRKINFSNKDKFSILTSCKLLLFVSLRYFTFPRVNLRFLFDLVCIRVNFLRFASILQNFGLTQHVFVWFCIDLF